MKVVVTSTADTTTYSTVKRKDGSPKKTVDVGANTRAYTIDFQAQSCRIILHSCSFIDISRLFISEISVSYYYGSFAARESRSKQSKRNIRNMMMFAKNSNKLSYSLKGIITCLGLLVSSSASATLFHGVEFPDGAVSFADSVVSYDPAYGGGNQPAATYQDATQALGIPNYPEGSNPEYVSLGAGGRLVLRFTDNSLTGSGDSALDLWIFEIGPDVEDTDVDISKDGTTWFSVGKVFGSVSGIDIDAFGFDTSDFFSFIRLTDVISEGQTTGTTVGADIDAVGAISSAPPVINVPEPAAFALFGIGLAAVGYKRRKHNK